MMEDYFGPAISIYSRSQAIDDGCLIDLSDVAMEEGFKFPVAITSAAFGQIAPGKEAAPGQDLRGRLHDMFFQMHLAIKNMSPEASEIRFSVILQDRGPWSLHLKAICGPGDDLAAVITVLLLEEVD